MRDEEHFNDKSNDSSDNNNDPTSNRTQIYEYIEKNPGTHLRKISKELGLAMGDTQYHLNILEKSGRIKSRKINLYRRYYSASILGEKEEMILAFLRQETTRGIMLYLIEHQSSTQSELAQFMHFSAPTISWHMSRLMEAGIVDSIRQGKKTLYSINTDREKLVFILKTYHPSVWNNLASRLAEVFLELSSSNINKIKKEKDGSNGDMGTG